MKISPIKQEILEKLYTKAYVTEKMIENQAKYTQFVDENFSSETIEELKGEILRSLVNYLFIGFFFLTIFFGKIDMFFSPTDENAKLLTGVMLGACGVSLLAGFFFNRKKIKILKWLKPFQIAKSLEISNNKKEALKKHEDWRAQKDQELRDKYLSEHAADLGLYAEKAFVRHGVTRKERISKFRLAKALKKPSIYALITKIGE